MKIILLIATLILTIGGNAQNKDWQELQGRIDTAVKYNGIVRIERNYSIDFPLIAAKWDSLRGDYIAFTIQILGNSTMWDVGGISQINYTGKDGFALGIHRGKGCVIKGVNFQGAYRSPAISEAQFFQSDFATYGDTTCRDRVTSPYAGVVIDPFRSNIPNDGGYPKLTKYYRGLGGNGGSTGFLIDNCTFNNFTVGLLFSPNGQTANCELMTVSNIRIYNTKAGFVGCQAQEKSNLLSNINCWGRTHTLFMWGAYGNGTPGLYNIDRVQIAGGVVRLVNRASGGYFPLTISNVFAEMLGSIGYWQSMVGDRLSNSVIGFAPPDITGSFPAYGHIVGQANNVTGIILDNSTIRYYGKPNLPILFNGEYNQKDINSYNPIMWGYKGRGQTKPGYAIDIIATDSGTNKTKPLPPGTGIIYMNSNSWIFEGLGMIGPDSTTIIYSSPNITNKLYGRGIYKKL